ncbi:hypothetical protein D3C72_2584190 [compost metagenome]
MHAFQLGSGDAPVVPAADKLPRRLRHLTQAPRLVQQLGNHQGQLVAIVAGQVVLALGHLQA